MIVMYSFYQFILENGLGRRMWANSWLWESTAEGATARDQDALRSTASVTRPMPGAQRTVDVDIARTLKEAKI